jgi:hypothetical protein
MIQGVGLGWVVREVRQHPEDHVFESQRWQWNNFPFCWLREVVVRERLLSLPVCRVTRVTHSALSAQGRPEWLGRRYTNPHFFYSAQQ